MPVRILPRAHIDLFEIWDFIAADSIVQADKMSDEFDRVFSLIAANPEIGRARDELEEGLRSFPVGHYVIFYEAVQERVEVLRVLHGARDILDQFDQ